MATRKPRKRTKDATVPTAQAMVGGVRPSDDTALLSWLGASNDWLRAALCTLARRGVALRQSDPARARRLIDALSTYPFYKGGQLLFDLMEWEDFMLDGPPPVLLPTVLDPVALMRLAAILQDMRATIDGGVVQTPGLAVSPSLPTVMGDEELPELEAGFYLYEDVVLGAVVSAAPLLDRVQLDFAQT